MGNRPRVLLALDYYDHRVHRGVARVASQQGWALIWAQQVTRMAAVPPHWSGDGIISLILFEETRRAVERTRTPFVDMGLMFDQENWHRVVVDNKQY